MRRTPVRAVSRMKFDDMPIVDFAIYHDAELMVSLVMIPTIALKPSKVPHWSAFASDDSVSMLDLLEYTRIVVNSLLNIGMHTYIYMYQ